MHPPAIPAILMSDRSAVTGPREGAPNGSEAPGPTSALSADPASAIGEAPRDSPDMDEAQRQPEGGLGPPSADIYRRIAISTRRLAARPAAVALLLTGRLEPKPWASIRSPPTPS